MADKEGRLPGDCKLSISPDDLDTIRERPINWESSLFAALANETRYEILLLLSAADGPVCGCELEPHLDVGQSSISQSLSRLRDVGLLTRTKDGRWRYYDTTPLAETLLQSLEQHRRAAMMPQ